MIRLKSVTKVFDQKVVVNNVSLSVEPGEIVGLLGPNGAGKTTTLRMIAGVLPPTQGSIRIDEINPFGEDESYKQKIGYLPENNPLYEEMTVEEHLHFWARMKGLSAAETKEAIEFSVKKTGIEEVYYRFIGELSKGYRQRVGLAQAILAKPEILLLDEPTEGLDPNQRREIQSLLEELKESRTVIVSSHVLSEIAKLANRVVIISGGKIVGDDTPHNLVQTKKGTQVAVVEIEGRGVKKALAGLKGVDQVTEEGDSFTVFYKGKEDVRRKIFALAVEKKWTLLSMALKERQLEDVFSELTQGESHE